MNSNQAIERITQCYGDLLFDLCESVLWSASSAQSVFRSVLREIRKIAGTNYDKAFERAQLLKIVCDKLRIMYKTHGRKLTALEQLELDADKNTSPKLNYFNHYFHKLSIDDQLLLLLKDKYGLSYSEISMTLTTSEDSLKVRRQQALRALEEWLWGVSNQGSKLSSNMNGNVNSDLNCFEWQNNCSDYLDGILMGGPKQKVEKHTEACSSCGEHYQHYRTILSAISSQPRTSLPIMIRKAPLAFALSRLNLSLSVFHPLPNGKKRWEAIPWYLRTTLEGFLAVILILLAISVGPKMRLLYERRMEKNTFKLNDQWNDPADIATLLNDEVKAQNAVAMAYKNTGGAANGIAEADDSANVDPNGVKGFDDFAGEDDEDRTANNKRIRVGDSEIWRFNLKTDSPHDFRAKIVKILSELQIPASTRGLAGIEAPGGIQFDLLVPKNTVQELKRQLQKIAPPVAQDTDISRGNETFAWYKNKSKRKIQDGKARVVIWLSQV